MKTVLLVNLNPKNGHFEKTVITAFPVCGKKCGDRMLEFWRILITFLNGDWFRKQYGYLLNIGKDGDADLRFMESFSV